MSIAWQNGFVTSMDLLTEPGFLSIVIINCILGTIVAQMILNILRYKKINNEYPTQVIIPLGLLTIYSFLFIEAIQYYYLRPIAFYFLLLFVVSGVIRLIIPRFLIKRIPRKTKSKKKKR